MSTFAQLQADPELRSFYQLAFLLVGDAEGALGALAEALRLGGDLDLTLAAVALRHAQELAPDRFYLRSLAEPEGPLRQLNRLAIEERNALLLKLSGRFHNEQIASLLRVPTEALAELLARVQRRFAEPDQLWPALLATVPEWTLALDSRLQGTLKGNDQPTEGPEPNAWATATHPARAPKGRWLWSVALLATLALVGLFIGLRDRPVDPVTTEVEEEVTPKPPDFTQYQADQVVRLTLYGGESLPADDAVRSIAQKVLQWTREATLLSDDPTATPGTEARTLILQFADGRTLWLVGWDRCGMLGQPCIITAGGDGSMPTRLQQPDLERWMIAHGWQLDLNPGGFQVRPAETGERRLDAEAVARIVEAATGRKVAGISPLGRLQLHQEPDGDWRTEFAPVWHVFAVEESSGLEQVGPRMVTVSRGEIILLDDQTGEILLPNARPQRLGE